MNALAPKRFDAGQRRQLIHNARRDQHLSRQLRTITIQHHAKPVFRIAGNVGDFTFPQLNVVVTFQLLQSQCAKF